MSVLLVSALLVLASSLLLFAYALLLFANTLLVLAKAEINSPMPDTPPHTSTCMHPNRRARSYLSVYLYISIRVFVYRCI